MLAQPGRREEGWLPCSKHCEAGWQVGSWCLAGLAVVCRQMSWLVGQGSQAGSRQAVSVQVVRWLVPGGCIAGSADHAM